MLGNVAGNANNGAEADESGDEIVLQVDSDDSSEDEAMQVTAGANEKTQQPRISDESSRHVSSCNNPLQQSMDMAAKEDDQVDMNKTIDPPSSKKAPPTASNVRTRNQKANEKKEQSLNNHFNTMANILYA